MFAWNEIRVLAWALSKQLNRRECRERMHIVCTSLCASNRKTVGRSSYIKYIPKIHKQSLLVGDVACSILQHLKCWTFEPNPGCSLRIYQHTRPAFAGVLRRSPNTHDAHWWNSNRFDEIHNFDTCQRFCGHRVWFYQFIWKIRTLNCPVIFERQPEPGLGGVPYIEVRASFGRSARRVRWA